MDIEQRLKALRLELPGEPKLPAGVVPILAWARVHRDRVYFSGHAPLAPDGTISGPFGRVGAEISLDQAVACARSAMLALLGSAHRALGSLEVIDAWLRIDGILQTTPTFTQMSQVMNGASRLLLEVFPEAVATHARSAVGVASSPLNLPVILTGQLAIKI